MPRKPTKTSLRRKLDKIVSEIVRKRGKCERCMSRQNLQACHINSRKYNLTRWDLENLLCLCAKCHAHFHDHPHELGDFVKKIKGEEVYEKLREVYKSITKFTLDGLQTKLKILQDFNQKRN